MFSDTVDAQLKYESITKSLEKFSDATQVVYISIFETKHPYHPGYMEILKSEDLVIFEKTPDNYIYLLNNPDPLMGPKITWTVKQITDNIVLTVAKLEWVSETVFNEFFFINEKKKWRLLENEGQEVMKLRDSFKTLENLKK